jgi:hypothetical protein
MGRKRTIRASAWLVALGAVLGSGCSDGVNAPPGPGILRVNVTVLGARPDSDGFNVDLGLEGQGVVTSQAVTSRLAALTFPALAPGRYTLALTALQSNCSVEGDQPLGVEIRATETSFAYFTVSCPREDVAVVYARQDAGEFAESFYLYADSTFLLDQGRYGQLEGTYSATDTEIVFNFGTVPTSYRATGKLHDTCMTLTYTFEMWMDGFQDGEFCLVTGT